MELIRCKEDGRYFVSSTGVILDTYKWKVCKTRLDRDGYERVILNVNGKCMEYPVHRIGANNFIENKENKPQVNHLNYIRHDNNVSNLEWVTPNENMQHAAINPSKVRSSHITSNKISEEEALLVISKKGKGITGKELANEIGCSPDIIYKIWQGKTWTHLQGGEK